LIQGDKNSQLGFILKSEYPTNLVAKFVGYSGWLNHMVSGYLIYFFISVIVFLIEVGGVV
jgi:hypothetical protein